MNIIKMAWRNLWRNKRRTLITIASIFFGVLLSTIMSSLQDGTYSNMIDMMVKISSGYLQVQDSEYRDHKSINNTLEPTGDLIKKIKNLKEVTQVEKRIESFALLSSGEKTRGGAVVGIEPDKDKQFSNLQSWVHKGEFLQKGDKGILITYNMADYLDVGINDSLVLLSQGYHGMTAAGLYPVKGILKFTTPQLNNLGVFMDLQLARQFFGAYGRATAIRLMVNDYTDVEPAQEKLNELLGKDFKVYTWRELQPEIVQFIESDRTSGSVMKGILYMVIGFGILGTVIMMVAERKRELGVMIAVGMQKVRLSLMLFYETIIIGLTGVVAGFIVSIPVILALVDNPIKLPPDLQEAYLRYGFEPYLFFGTAPEVFVNQILTVFIITLVVSIHPVVTVMRMKVTNALRT
ncbi:MAG: ABC transporter permease [Bacteroidales bacterium]|nr:ABC transporter permease [Bacteroidales bacterium]